MSPRFLFFILCLLLPVVVRANDDAARPNCRQNAAKISQHISDGYAARKIVPAEFCSDEVFVRRTYLDLVGRIPTVAERETYLADSREDKHQHLIETLVQSEDYAQHFTDIFDTLLLGRTSRKVYDQRRNAQWRSWLERVFRDNRPWDKVVNEILRARPETQDDRGVVWFLYERNNKPQEIAEAVAPAFFGIRIECAQCHDHMIADEIEQAHYWGLVGFFNRGKNVKTKNGPRVSESAIGGFSEFASLDGESYPNRLTFFQATTVEEKRPGKDEKQKDAAELYVPASLTGDPRVPKFSRREKFVEQIASNHPLVARAFVNRVWAILLGRGIVHPFDEMDSVHPPSHPKLLNDLTDDFEKSGYDIRRLVASIAMSDPYRRQATRPTGVDDPASFAWYLERPLTAEQLARSMQLAVRGEFANDHKLVSDLRDTLTKVLPDENVTTVREALFLTNNPALNTFLAESTGDQHLPQKLGAMSPNDAAQTAVKILFGRDCRAEEQDAIVRFLNASESNPQTNSNSKRIQQLLWSLLTSAEFHLNH